MRILQVVHTALKFEPPVFALGTLLAGQGHEVECVGYWTPGLRLEEEVAPGYRLVRIPRGDWKSLPRLVRGGIRYEIYRRAVVARARTFMPEVIVSTNFDSLPIGVRIARENGSRLAYYCLEYSTPPGLKEYLTGWGFLKRRERSSIRFPDRICSVEPNRAALQAAEWGRAVDHVILNAPPYNEVIDRKAASAIERRDLADSTLRLVYAGSIDRRNCIRELVEAVRALPSVHLDLYGTIIETFGSEFRALLEGSKMGSEERVRYRGEVPYSDLAPTLVDYDFGVTLYDGIHRNTNLASPAKLFQYMQAGLGAVTSDQPTPATAVTESGGGVVTRIGCKGDLQRVLSSLAGRPVAEWIRMRRDALTAFRERFTYERQAAPLLEWIREESGKN